MDKPIFELEDGTKTTIMSDFIRQEFNKNKTRKEIQQELSNILGRKVPIRTVYSATARMENERVKSKKPVYIEFSDGSKMLRAEYIRERVLEERASISEVAEELDVPYQTVYSTVKDYDNLPVKKIGKKRIIEIDGEEISWKEAILKKYNSGMTVREIADYLDEDYQPVYQVIYKERKKGNLD